MVNEKSLYCVDSLNFTEACNCFLRTVSEWNSLSVLPVLENHTIYWEVLLAYFVYFISFWGGAFIVCQLALYQKLLSSPQACYKMQISLLLRYGKANRCLLLKRQIVPHRLQEKWVHNLGGRGPGQHQVLSGGKIMGKTLHCGFGGKSKSGRVSRLRLWVPGCPWLPAWPWWLGQVDAGLEREPEAGGGRDRALDCLICMWKVLP